MNRRFVERIFGVSMFLFCAAQGVGFFIAGWYYDRFVYALLALGDYVAAREILKSLRRNWKRKMRGKHN
jgi:hypothetical protein